MIGIYVISIAFMLIGWLVSMQLKRKFKQYSEVTIGTGMSGKEIAERMLHDNGINDVKVLSQHKAHEFCLRIKQLWTAVNWGTR